MKKSLIIISVIIIIALIIGGTFWLIKSHKGQVGEKVSIRLCWLHQSQFAGFYFADKAGFYKNEELNVTFNPGGVDFPAIQSVIGGSDQFGIATAQQIILAREKSVPVVAIAMIFRKNPWVLFSLKESGIDSVQKFVGKKIGVSYGDSDEYFYRAMLKNAGVDSKDVEEVPAQFDITPLLTKQVDVWPGYSYSQPVNAEEKGFQVNLIWPSDYGINAYGVSLFTTEKMIKEKPDVVRKFVSATIKGWQQALENQQLAVSYTLQYSDQLNYEHETRAINTISSLVKPDERPIGFMDKAMWESMQDFLLKQNLMKQTVDINKMFTTEFLQ